MTTYEVTGRWASDRVRVAHDALIKLIAADVRSALMIHSGDIAVTLTSGGGQVGIVGAVPDVLPTEEIDVIAVCEAASAQGYTAIAAAFEKLRHHVHFRRAWDDGSLRLTVRANVYTVEINRDAVPDDAAALMGGK